ncbi:MAG: EFR1 family ferrodoxin [Clostridia bacterium]|nr:EFR1 family ferrodoxin [Clostridia bacterium]
MKKIQLYYFTGSGNTLKIAEYSKQKLEEMNYEVSLEAMESVKNYDWDHIAFVGLFFPVAIQSTYPIVWDFIEGLPKQENQKIFMVDTMDQFSGGVVGPMKKVLESKGFDCVGAIELKMSSSMLTKSINRTKLELKNAKALNQVGIFLEKLLEGKTTWRRVPILSDWMRSISKGRKIWTQQSRKIQVNHEACIRCKICMRQCPVEALSLIDEKIEINHEICNSCMRCVHKCPKDAFEVNRKKVIRLK